MKVTPSTSAATSAGASSARPAEGFGRLLDAAATSGRTPVSGAAPSAPVANISGVLSLQGLTDPEARARALRKGRRMLDALDRLQISMLGSGPTRGDLARLEASLEDSRLPSGDEGLDETLNWAEVRVAVEAAKLRKAAEVA